MWVIGLADSNSWDGIVILLVWKQRRCNTKKNEKRKKTHTHTHTHTYQDNLEANVKKQQSSDLSSHPKPDTLVYPRKKDLKIKLIHLIHEGDLIYIYMRKKEKEKEKEKERKQA